MKCTSHVENKKEPENTLQSNEEDPEYSPQLDEEEPEYSSQYDEEYNPSLDDDMYNDTNDDTYGEDFIVNCGIMSLFPEEYDMVSKVSEADEDFMLDETAEGKPLCHYLMNNGVVEEQKAMFERPSPGMMYHLKPLFIREKVDEVVVNKVFIDGGEIVILMPHTLFKKMGKCDADLQQHNMVLSNYEGKTNNILEVIQVDLAVGTTTRSTFFMVINSRENFNLLLGREWIYGIGEVPSTVHKRLIIWRKDGIVENIKADQSYYKIDEAKGAKKYFDQYLVNIAPCDDESGSYTSVNTCRVLNLDHDYGFIWDV